MWNRLKTWKETMTARSAMLPQREQKSLDAENDVVEHLKTLPGVISVWPSVRIPDPTRLQGAGKSTLSRSLAKVWSSLKRKTGSVISNWRTGTWSSYA